MTRTRTKTRPDVQVYQFVDATRARFAEEVMATHGVAVDRSGATITLKNKEKVGAFGVIAGLYDGEPA